MQDADGSGRLDGASGRSLSTTNDFMAEVDAGACYSHLELMSRANGEVQLELPSCTYVEEALPLQQQRLLLLLYCYCYCY